MEEHKYNVRDRIKVYRQGKPETSGDGARHDDDEKNTRRSVGIACFAPIEENGVTRLKVLLGTKRFSYALNEIAQGKYTADKAELAKKFDNMYLEDKLVVASMTFDYIWYRVWLNFHRTPSYYIAKSKFESTFLVDQGNMLRRLIERSKNKPRVWEVPKGRKKNKSEADINCAMREFQEETGMTSKMYKLYPDVKRTYSFTDNGITYINTYYLAFTRTPISPEISLKNKDQVDEMGELKWMDLDEIRTVDTNGHLEQFLKPMMNYVRNRLRE